MDYLEGALEVAVELTLVDQAAAELVDDRCLLDAHWTGLDTRVALITGPDRLLAHAAGPDDRVGVAGLRLSHQERAQDAADPRVLLGAARLLVQLEDHIARRERLAGRVRGAGGVTAAALGARVELEQMVDSEVPERGVAGKLVG